MEPASQWLVLSAGKDNQLKCRKRLKCCRESQGKSFIEAGYSFLQAVSLLAGGEVGEAPGSSQFLIVLPKCLSLSSPSSQFFPQKGSSLLGSPLTLCVYPFDLLSVYPFLN